MIKLRGFKYETEHDMCEIMRPGHDFVWNYVKPFKQRTAETIDYFVLLLSKSNTNWNKKMREETWL